MTNIFLFFSVCLSWAARYLAKIKTTSHNGEAVLHYRWGQRARAQICHRDIIMFIAQVSHLLSQGEGNVAFDVA